MLLAVSKARGMEWGCIPRIASGLGGGMGRQGEVCGALTAGVMMVGLVYGPDGVEEKEAKEAVYTRAGEFVRRFDEVNGAVRCRDITGVDLSSEEGIQEYRSRNLKEEKCAGVVSNGVRVLLDLLEE